MNYAQNPARSHVVRRLLTDTGVLAPSAFLHGTCFFIVRGATAESAGGASPAMGVTRVLGELVWPQNARYRGHTPRPWCPSASPAQEAHAPAVLEGGEPAALRLSEVRARAEQADRAKRRIAAWRRTNTRGQQVRRGRVTKAEKRKRRDLLFKRAGAHAASRGTVIHQHMGALLTMDAETFARTYRRKPEPTAVRFLRAVCARNWHAERAEFCVGDAVMPMATGIDLLASDERGRAVFVELKTGHAGGAFTAVPADAAEARLREPPEGYGHVQFGRDLGLTNCARDRATIQHLVGVTMVAEHYGLRPGRDYVAWLARVDHASDAMEWYELPQSLLERGPAVLRALRAMHTEAQMLAEAAKAEEAAKKPPAKRKKAPAKRQKTPAVRRR